MKAWMYIFFFVSTCLGSRAQRICGTMEYLQKNRSQFFLRFPVIPQQALLQQSDQFLQEPGNPPGNGVGNPGPIRVPVVVHVIYHRDQENISLEQINSQLDALNADFNQKNKDFNKVPAAFAQLAGTARIQFELARTDLQGRPTQGIIRKKSTRMLWSDDDKIKKSAEGGDDPWDSRHYLNIWVGNLVNGLLGYATFPGGPAESDGIVMRHDIFGTVGRLRAPFDKGRTLTHEMGHWLNLKHLWGDLDCGDDDVQDTPPQAGHSRGCPMFPLVSNSCHKESYGSMFMNFMDFTDDACMQMFTAGQVQRMLKEFAPGGGRSAMLLSRGLDKPWNETAPTSDPDTRQVKLLLSPNPVQGDRLFCQVPQGHSLQGHGFRILNSLGAQVMTGVCNSKETSIDVSSLGPGIYFIRFSSDGAGYAGRFIRL